MFRYSLRTLKKWPDIAFTSCAALVWSSLAMSATGGPPNAYEMREAQAAIARIAGNEDRAEAIESRHIWVEAVHLIPAQLYLDAATQPAAVDTELALLGGDLLGGPLEPPPRRIPVPDFAVAAEAAPEPQLIAAAETPALIETLGAVSDLTMVQ